MTENSRFTPKVYFPNLDGFRTVAFLMVFFGHCYFILWNTGDKSILTRAMKALLGIPAIGVNFFFVLSGFLISYLLLTENHYKCTINWRAFYIRRVLRIWPVYFLVVLMGIILSVIPVYYYDVSNISWWKIVLFLTNFNFVTGIDSYPIGILWSVAVEEQFYLFLPLLLVFFSRKVFYFLIPLIVCSLAFRFYFAGNQRVIEFHTFSVAGSLFLGCCCAYFCLYHKLADYFRKLPRGVIIMVYLLFAFMHIRREFIMSYEAGHMWYPLFYSLFFAFFILEQNYSDRSFFKMKNFKLLTGWGKYTYGMYAYHMIAITFFIPVFQKLPEGPLVFFTWPAALAVTYIFGRFSYHFMEKKFLTLKERFSASSTST